MKSRAPPCIYNQITNFIYIYAYYIYRIFFHLCLCLSNVLIPSDKSKNLYSFLSFSIPVYLIYFLVFFPKAIWWKLEFCTLLRTFLYLVKSKIITFIIMCFFPLPVTSTPPVHSTMFPNTLYLCIFLNVSDHIQNIKLEVIVIYNINRSWTDNAVHSLVCVTPTEQTKTDLSTLIDN